MLPLIK